MIYNTKDKKIIKLYDNRLFLKFYNDFLNGWAINNNFDDVEEDILLFGKNKRKTANEYILRYIDPELFEEFQRRFKYAHRLPYDLNYGYFMDSCFIYHNIDGNLELKKDLFSLDISLIKYELRRLLKDDKH